MFRYVVFPLVVLILASGWAISEFGWKGAVGVAAVLLGLPFLLIGIVKAKIGRWVQSKLDSIGGELAGADVRVVSVTAAPAPSDGDQRRLGFDRMIDEVGRDDDYDDQERAEEIADIERQREAFDRSRWIHIELDITPRDPPDAPDIADEDDDEPDEWEPTSLQLLPLADGAAWGPIGWGTTVEDSPASFMQNFEAVDEDNECDTVEWAVMRGGEWRTISDEVSEEDADGHALDAVTGRARVRLTAGVSPGTRRLGLMYAVRPLGEPIVLPPELTGPDAPIVIEGERADS